MPELMLRDTATAAFNAFQDGRKLAQDRRTQNALAGYNPANPEATQNALIQGGDVDTARQLQTQQLGGDLRQQQIEAAKQARLTKHHDYVEAEAGKLQGILAQQGPEAVLQAFDANLPTYQQMGEDPQALASLRQMLTVNPEAALAALAGVRKPDLRQSGRFVRGIDPLTGEEKFSYDLPQDELAQELLAARIEATRAQVPLREAQADRARRAPAGRGRGGGGGASLSTMTDEQLVALARSMK